MEFRVEGETVTFWLRVKPGARRERLGRTAAGELHLEVSAPPVEGRANEACAKFLARALRLPRSAVTILAGQKARRKLIRIEGRLAKETVAGIESLAAEGQAKVKGQESKVTRTVST